MTLMVTLSRKLAGTLVLAASLVAPLIACGPNTGAPPPATPSAAMAPASAPSTVVAPGTPASATTPTIAPTASAASDPAVPEVAPMTSSGATLTWYGHAAFKLVTASGKVVWFDPWVTNPKNPAGKEDLAKVDKADLILVSHGHFDHVGDAVAIGKKTHAKLVTTFDLGRALVAVDGYPKEGAGFDSQGNVGGDLSFFDGEITVSFVPAVHGSMASTQDAKGNPFGDLRPAGEAGGFVVTIKNGPVIYHTGDTDLFGDMALIGKYHRVNVMLACIGGHFTMGPERAAEAARLVAPSVIVPMHYGTFPILTGTPEALEDAVAKKGLHTRVKIVQLHEELKL